MARKQTLGAAGARRSDVAGSAVQNRAADATVATSFAAAVRQEGCAAEGVTAPTGVARLHAGGAEAAFVGDPSIPVAVRRMVARQIGSALGNGYLQARRARGAGS